jgi:hypothetical protein
MMMTVIFIGSMFIALVLQHFVGAVPGLGSQILLLPLVFLCGASALPFWSVLVLAYVAGLMWDCLGFLPVEGRAELPFGATILLYAGIGALMNGLRPLYLRGLWHLHVVMTGLLISLLALIEYAVITFRREPFQLIWPREIWIRIGGSGLVAGLLAIPCFLLLNWVGRRAGLFDRVRSIV